MGVVPFHLFCRVIDNFGDAGVCWRLACRLVTLGHPVRLWIDAPGVLARLVPEVNPDASDQTIQGVRIGPWSAAQQATPSAGGVVVEAFACTLPAEYRAAMAAAHCLWINLEYLSAESWVEGCHGLPSPQASGVPKHFYFPGFTRATGGLLREPDLLTRRAAARRHGRRQRLQELTGLPAEALPTEDALCILLFCYPGAPLAGLQAALAQHGTPTWVLVPGGMADPAVLHDQGNLQVLDVPFVPQARFDELLWCCDLNFVRGEDSLVRAIWAGTPLVWQVYPQADGAHLDKLDAWLSHARWPLAAAELTRAWNRPDPEAVAAALTRALAAEPWRAWQARSLTWSNALAREPDLARNLQDFCLRHLRAVPSGIRRTSL